MQPRLRVRDLVLDKTSMVPLYLQLEQHLIHLISYGAWRPNESVPSVRQLAADLQMATATVQRAYNDLQAAGLLVGRPGRGVFVTDLASGIPVRTRERGEMLRALLAGPVSHARSLGFSNVELLEAIDAVASGPATPVTPAASPHVVFVGMSPAAARKYPALLSGQLERHGLTVRGVVLADLQRDESILDRFEPIQMLVALIGTFPALQEMARRRATPIYGLVLDLTEAAQHALIHLPPDGPVALIAQQVYAPSARALLRNYFVAEERIRWAEPTDLPRVRELLAACPTVVYTLAATEVVREHAPPSAQTMELEYVPNPASLARLASLLSPEAVTA